MYSEKHPVEYKMTKFRNNTLQWGENISNDKRDLQVSELLLHSKVVPKLVKIFTISKTFLGQLHGFL